MKTPKKVRTQYADTAGVKELFTERKKKRRQYADTTGVKGIFAGYKSKKEERQEYLVSKMDLAISNPAPAQYWAYEASINADIACRPWAYDYATYWPLEVEDQLRRERAEEKRDLKTRESIKKLEERLAYLKGML